MSNSTVLQLCDIYVLRCLPHSPAFNVQAGGSLNIPILSAMTTKHCGGEVFKNLLAVDFGQ